jgi:hypothetical protein
MAQRLPGRRKVRLAGWGHSVPRANCIQSGSWQSGVSAFYFVDGLLFDGRNWRLVRTITRPMCARVRLHCRSAGLSGPFHRTPCTSADKSCDRAVAAGPAERPCHCKPGIFLRRLPTLFASLFSRPTTELWSFVRFVSLDKWHRELTLRNSVKWKGGRSDVLPVVLRARKFTISTHRSV